MLLNCKAYGDGGKIKGPSERRATGSHPRPAPQLPIKGRDQPDVPQGAGMSSSSASLPGPRSARPHVALFPSFAIWAWDTLSKITVIMTENMSGIAVSFNPGDHPVRSPPPFSKQESEAQTDRVGSWQDSGLHLKPTTPHTTSRQLQGSQPLVPL